MRKCLSAALLSAGTAVTLTLGLAATPVGAATATWTVTPGGNFYSNEEGQNTYLADTSTGIIFRCDSFGIDGQFKSGSGLTNYIGKVKTASGGGEAGGQLGVLLCAGKGIAFYAAFGNLPWGIRAIRYDATAGETFGKLVRISATVSAQSGFPACSAAIDGMAPGAGDGTLGFWYLNNGTFHTRGGGTDLHFYDVSGCNGVINNGDSITYYANDLLYAKVRPGMTPNSITSP